MRKNTFTPDVGLLRNLIGVHRLRGVGVRSIVQCFIEGYWWRRLCNTQRIRCHWFSCALTVDFRRARVCRNICYRWWESLMNTISCRDARCRWQTTRGGKRQCTMQVAVHVLNEKIVGINACSRRSSFSKKVKKTEFDQHRVKNQCLWTLQYPFNNRWCFPPAPASKISSQLDYLLDPMDLARVSLNLHVASIDYWSARFLISDEQRHATVQSSVSQGCLSLQRVDHFVERLPSSVAKPDDEPLTDENHRVYLSSSDENSSMCQRQ